MASSFNDWKAKKGGAGPVEKKPAPVSGGGGSKKGFNDWRAKKGGAPAEPQTPKPFDMSTFYDPDAPFSGPKPPERDAYAEYDALPEWQKPAVAAYDIISAIGDTASFGYADKAASKLRSMALGTEYEDELANARRLTGEARERAGWAGTTGELASLVAAPGAAEKFVSKAPGAVGAVSRGLGYGAEGAAMGGLNAAGHDEDVGTGMVTGGAGGVGGSALGGFLNKIFGRTVAKGTQKYPTNASIVDAADAATKRTKPNLDLKARARRVEEAARAQAGGKQGFADLAKGIENAGRKNTGHTYSELEAIRRAGRTDTTPIANAFSTLGEAMKLKGVPWFVKHVTGIPVVGAGVRAGADLSKSISSSREAENVLALLRDPSGQGLKLSPEAVNELRNKLSRTFIGSSFNAGD